MEIGISRKPREVTFTAPREISVTPLRSYEVDQAQDVMRSYIDGYQDATMTDEQSRKLAGKIINQINLLHGKTIVFRGDYYHLKPGPELIETHSGKRTIVGILDTAVASRHENYYAHQEDGHIVFILFHALETIGEDTAEQATFVPSWLVLGQLEQLAVLYDEHTLRLNMQLQSGFIGPSFWDQIDKYWQFKTNRQS